MLVGLSCVVVFGYFSAICLSSMWFRLLLYSTITIGLMLRLVVS